MSVLEGKGPHYQRIKQHILDRIISGELSPGSRIPSENQLVSHFKLSRMTVHRALRELTADGWLSRQPGVGTFVSRPQERASLVEIHDIARDIALRGNRHGIRLIALQSLPAEPEIAESFEIASGSLLYRAMLVHEENANPVQLEQRWVNAAIARSFIDQDFSRTTPTAWLMEQFPVEELEHTVTAELPSREERQLLKLEEGEPCLVLNRRSFAMNGVLTVARLVYPGQRYALHSRFRTTPLGIRGGHA